MVRRLFFIFICVLLFFGCTSQKKLEKTGNEQESYNCCFTSDNAFSENLWLDDDNVGNEIFVTGVLISEKCDDGTQLFVINENNDSRSKISFSIKKDSSDSKAYNSLKDYVGKIVSAKGILLKNSSPWNNVISLTELEVLECK